MTVTRPALRDIPTRNLADAVRAAELLDDRDRIGFASRGVYAEATVAAIRAELAHRQRVASRRGAAPAPRLRLRDLFNLGSRSRRVSSA